MRVKEYVKRNFDELAIAGVLARVMAGGRDLDGDGEMVLEAFRRSTPELAHADLDQVQAFADQAEQAGKERIKYTVEEGDTLKSISKKFGIKVSSIARINQFGFNHASSPGEEIILYVKKKTSENPPPEEGGPDP